MPDFGWFTPSLLVLPLQAIAAAASVRMFASRVAPNILRLHAPNTVIDSLGPFALAMPLICAGWRTQSNAAATGWIAVGAPVTIAMLAVSAALCASILRATNHNRSPAAGRRADSLRSLAVAPHSLSISPLAAIAWSAVGGMLLLLGAANDLTVWIGQCAFALGAVLLWMNTPELPRDEPDSIEAHAGSGLTLVLFFAIIQCIAMLITPAKYLPVAAAIAIAHSAMIVMLAATLASPVAAIRIGGWTAAYGILLGLGAISLRHLLPTAMIFAGGDRPRPPLKVAYGFGAFALEAMILLLLGIAVLALDRVTARKMRIAIGAILILAAALLTGWRLDAM